MLKTTTGHKESAYELSNRTESNIGGAAILFMDLRYDFAVVTTINQINSGTANISKTFKQDGIQIDDEYGVVSASVTTDDPDPVTATTALVENTGILSVGGVAVGYGFSGLVDVPGSAWYPDCIDSFWRAEVLRSNLDAQSYDFDYSVNTSNQPIGSFVWDNSGNKFHSWIMQKDFNNIALGGYANYLLTGADPVAVGLIKPDKQLQKNPDITFYAIGLI